MRKLHLGKKLRKLRKTKTTSISRERSSPIQTQNYKKMEFDEISLKARE